MTRSALAMLVALLGLAGCPKHEPPKRQMNVEEQALRNNKVDKGDTDPPKKPHHHSHEHPHGPHPHASSGHHHHPHPHPHLDGQNGHHHPY